MPRRIASVGYRVTKLGDGFVPDGSGYVSVMATAFSGTFVISSTVVRSFLCKL
jgi:hypothetical protein